MKYRRLGTNGPEISVVGFGAWAVGGAWQFGWGEQDDAESVAAIRHALESGVNWVDTAATYGHGHSEEVVGRALEPYAVGEDVCVFTKCGLSWYSTESGEVENNLRPESIRFECEQSLKRLGVERIDLCISSTGPMTSPERGSRIRGPRCSSSSRRARFAGAASQFRRRTAGGVQRNRSRRLRAAAAQCHSSRRPR
jgi:diketogulonate reductase-like aldo/keto reductase